MVWETFHFKQIVVQLDTWRVGMIRISVDHLSRLDDITKILVKVNCWQPQWRSLKLINGLFGLLKKNGNLGLLNERNYLIFSVDPIT